MSEIVKRIDEALSLVGAAKVEIEAQLKKIDEAIIDAAARNDALNAKALAIAEREATVKKIEDISALGEQARADASQARAELGRLEAEKIAFSKYVVESKKELALLQQKVEDSRIGLNLEYAALAKERAKLEKDKQDMVAKIIANLSSGK